MCYAIPGQVIELKGQTAVMDYFGERRAVHHEFEDLRVGEYAYAQGGILVQRIPTEAAMSALAGWPKRLARLKEIDGRLSALGSLGQAPKALLRILNRATRGMLPSREDALGLLQLTDQAQLGLLFGTANRVRRRALGNSCCVHGIIEFSNHCRNNCAYCGIRRGNNVLKRYRMDVDEIAAVARDAVHRLGFKALVLQSGEDPWYTSEKLCAVIRRIREGCGVLLFMSVGSRSLACYDAMHRAGARGVLLRFETSNPALYRQIHAGPKADLRHRLALLRHAAQKGYVVATGALVGLLGQTEEDVLDDVVLANDLRPEMYSFGPLIPHPDTPLAGTPPVSLNTMLKVIAVTRLLNPTAKILVTTALETLDPEGRRLGLLAGANSLMINVTPAPYRPLYAIYPGKTPPSTTVEQDIKEALALLYSLGRAPTDLGT